MSSDCLIKGAIEPDIITELIKSNQTKSNIGAYDVFLGQVRADKIKGKTVEAIEYTSYEGMADVVVSKIKEDVFRKYDQLASVEIKHSIGRVASGEISLLVFVSSRHRNQAFRACQEIVELIKKKIPVWKKEIFNDGTHSWVGTVKI